MRKDVFISEIKKRSMSLALNIIALHNDLSKNILDRIIADQFIRSASSIGANYSSCCVARSRKEFFSKLSIVIEETHETIYWLEMLESLYKDLMNFNFKPLIEETTELLKIFVSVRYTMFKKRVDSIKH